MVLSPPFFCLFVNYLGMALKEPQITLLLKALGLAEI